MKNLCFFIASLFCLKHIQAQNYSLGFNGTSQYISIPDQNSLDLSGSFTIEGWIYPTGPGSHSTQGGMILNKESSYEIARFADGTIQYALSANGTGGDWSWTNTGLVAPLNVWSHFALVKSGTNVTVYLNGAASFTSSSNPVTLAANTQELRIANRTSSAQYFNGNTDEFRIWNTARTQAQIKVNMFNKGVAVNASGLVAYYRMNENTGTTTANSCTNSSGINGTLANAPTWGASPVQFTANSLSFDGTDDLVTIPNDASLNISAAITLEAWVYASKNTGTQNVICKSNNSTNTGYIFPRTDDGWANVSIYLYIGSWRVITTTYPSLNAWHHLAATYDGANIKMYIDGVLKTTVPQTGAIAVNSNTLSLGNQPGWSENFGGYMDEVRIWNVARTQAQIQAAMNIELDPTTQTGLVSYYTFNQGVTTGSNTGLAVLPDLKGNNNGTLTNFALSSTSSNFLSQFASLALLPVSWLEFTAQVHSNNVLLNWSTASEQNAASFTIQHSANGSAWNTIATVAAAGNSSTTRQYSFVHNMPGAGPNYYRIMVQDLDSKTSFSKVVKIIYGKSASPLKVFPNPATGGELHLQLQQATTIYIYNSAGIMVLRKQLAAGVQQLNVSGLAKGAYQLKAGDETVGVLLQ